MNVAVVIPTIRPKKMEAWKVAWDAELSSVNAELLVVNDRPGNCAGLNWYAYEEIDDTLKERSHIISRKTDGIRCFGFLQALGQGADIIITLDDDVTPTKGCLKQHVENLSRPTQSSAWFRPLELRTRGLPYASNQRQNRCVVSHGLWHGVPDLDAPSQLLGTDGGDFKAHEGGVPRGLYAPLSAMNLAFHKDIACAYYFPPQGQGQPFDRFGDIWAGIIAKRVCDHMGWGVHSGEPFVHHERASNPFTNLIKEAPGIAANENFWKVVDTADLNGAKTAPECIDRIAEHFISCKDPYLRLTGANMKEWLSLLP